MKNDPHLLKTHEQPSATVIHHYEDDQTLLYRWLKHGLDKGPMFWLLAFGVVAATVVVFVLVGGLLAGREATHRAWVDLMVAKGADDQLRIAEAESETKVGPWARLQAAEGRYSEGLRDLIQGNREAALPLLRRAHELFAQAQREAPNGSDVRRLAALGMARALEARGELEPAIAQYQTVAREFANTAEGTLARELAERLKQPESVEFYRQLAALKPREAPGPASPTGTGLPFDFNLPSGHPPLDDPSSPASLLPPALDLPPAGASRVGGGELPSSLFENNPPAEPKKD